MKRIIVIFFIALSVIVQAQPTISNNSMFYRSLAENGLLNGLISVWELDETSGTTAFDSHGSNNGTTVGATVNQTGLINKAYDFNGSSDYISTAYTPTIGDFSMSAWFKADAFATDNMIIDCGNGGGNHVCINAKSTGIQCIFNAGTGASSITGTAPSTGTWYHTVVTMNSTANEVILYVNTVSFSNTLKTINVVSAAQPIYINKGAVRTWYMDGLIDQCAIWSKTLTPTEVATLYNSGNGLAYVDFTAYIEKMYDNLIPLKYNPLDVEIPLRMAS